MSTKKMKITSFILLGVAIIMILANLIAGFMLPGPKIITFVLFAVILTTGLALFMKADKDSIPDNEDEPKDK